MAIEIKVPEMGESISEGTVAGWRVQPGEPFHSGDVLLEIETDKVTQEIYAPADGTLIAINAKNGDTVMVGEVVAKMEAGAGPGNTQKNDLAPSTSSASAPSAQPAGTTNSPNVQLPPGARRLAEEKNVNPAEVKGSGIRGQVTKEDIVRHLEKPDRAPAHLPSIDDSETVELETVVPMNRLRQKIAERLVESQQTAAILTTFNEVDMHPVMELRKKYKDLYLKKYGVGLGFMSFFTKAAIAALKSYPALNAEIRGTDIVYKNYYDIGVAVGGPKGLVVPVIRNADQLSFAGIENEILRLAGKVKDGSISLGELQGGTFTITNGGVYGSMLSTPILNPPQSGILGMHNIVKRPVVIDDEIKIRPIMYIALSYDHRIVDGQGAVGFLVKLKECIESPERMLLEI